jgi:hypothetical protein
MRRALLLAALVLVPAAHGADGFGVALNGATAGATLNGTVHLEAAVAGAHATRVEFVVDGWQRHVEREAPYTWDWETPRELAGKHTVELWAVADDGRVATASLTVKVSNPFRIELEGAPERAKGEVALRANITGPQPQWVELIIDGQVRLTDDRPPYALRWDTTAESDGPHTVTLWAVAPNGAASMSRATVTVSNGVLGRESAEQLPTYRSEALRLEGLMQKPGGGGPIGGGTVDFWRKRAQEARSRAARPQHLTEFLCIHRYEGSWIARTGNGYFGGLQMNMDFMRAYGPELLARKGTADKWTPLEQIWVAERAVPSRGFHPWPQTAHMCGYI